MYLVLSQSHCMGFAEQSLNGKHVRGLNTQLYSGWPIYSSQARLFTQPRVSRSISVARASCCAQRICLEARLPLLRCLHWSFSCTGTSNLHLASDLQKARLLQCFCCINPMHVPVRRKYTSITAVGSLCGNDNVSSCPFFCQQGHACQPQRAQPHPSVQKVKSCSDRQSRCCRVCVVSSQNAQ